MAAALIFTVLAGAQERELIEFEIEDQFKVKHTDDEYRDRIVVLVGAGRKGSEFSPVWREAVGESFSAEIDQGLVKFLDYADTRGVPFFLKGAIRGYFPQDPDSFSLVDWKGSLAQAYEMDPDEVTLLLFGTDGRLVTRVSGTEVEAAKVDAFVGMLRDLLENPR